MSDLDSTLQQGLTPCITLGIQIGSQVVVVLRNFLDYWYLQLSQTDGSEKYANFLKESKGAYFKDELEFAAVAFDLHKSNIYREPVSKEERLMLQKMCRKMGIDYKGAYFKDELEFAAVAFDLHKSNIYREPVSKEERLMLQKMCRKMGIDYCLAKRPGNLDELITKKYVLNQSLSPQEEKLVNAFLCLDEKGNPIFETEDRNGHKIPKVRDDAYLLTIAEKDLQEEKLVNAFLCLDEKGNPIFETEDRNGHKIPKVRDDAYLLTIAEKDLPKWDLICTHLEAIGKKWSQNS